MTIETTTNRATYDGDGTSVDFSFPYKFNENADLVVIVVDANGNPATQVLGTDYTVTGATDDDGGTVTFTTAPEDGVSIVIYRDPPRTQGLDLVANDALPAESIENALDKGVMISQRLFDILGRVLRLSDSVVSDPTLAISPEAGSVLGWDSNGDIENKTLPEGTAVYSTIANTRAGSEDGEAATPESVASLWKQGSDIVSATTLTKPANSNLGGYHVVTGTTNIENFWTDEKDGLEIELRFSGGLSLLASGNIKGLPGGADLAVAAGSILRFRWEDNGASVRLMNSSAQGAIQGQCTLMLDGDDLKLSRCDGGLLTINGANQVIPSTGVTLAATGLTADTTYYIYAYMDGSTLTLEASTTTHVADSASGLRVKSGDATRTLVGMARPVTGPAWVDSGRQRLVLSYFNRRNKGSIGTFSADRTTTSTTTVEINSEIRNEILTWSDEEVVANITATISLSSALTCTTYLGVDGSATAYTYTQSTDAGSRQYGTAGTQILSLTEGYHYLSLMGKMGSAGTLTYPANSSTISAVLRG